MRLNQSWARIGLILGLFLGGCTKQAPPPPTVAVIHGTSMEPLLHEGDLRMVYRKSYKDLEKHDIALIWYGKLGWVAHELYRKHPVGGGWITKGINNSAPDIEPLTENSYGGIIFADIKTNLIFR